MYIYIVLLIVVIITIILENYFTNNRKFYITFVDVLLLIIFILFYSLRDNIGYDYPMYERTVYAGFADEVYASKGEILSASLLNIAEYFYDAHIFFFLVALITLPLIFYSLKYNTYIKDSLSLGILSFLALPIGFVNSLSIQRQFLAIGILLFSIKYLLSRNFVKYLCCLIIACFFHISSIVYIFVYFITSNRFKYKYFVYIFIIGYIFIFIGMKILISIFPFYEYYLLSLNSFKTGGQLQIIMYILFAIIYIILKKYLIKRCYYNIFLKAYLWGLISTLWLIPFDANVAFRFGSFGLIQTIFLISYIPQAFNKTSKIFIKIMLMILLSIIYIYNLYITTGTAYIPYKTFL